MSAALLEDVDGYLLQPVRPWQAALTVKSVLDKLRARRLNQELTSQLQQSNRRLLETKQALNGQNQELQCINERLRLLNTAKQMFASMIVHDLRTPLSAVMSALELLESDAGFKLNERQQETMNGALAAGQQMVRLTNALLDLHLLEEGQLPLSLEPVDPNSITTASLEQLRPMFEVHEIRVQVDFQESLPTLYVDWVVTQRVIENLIDNAIKFTPPGGEIVLRSHQDGDDVVFSVKDSGPGIPNDQKQVMVERFKQLSFNEVVVQPGFGLGLAFCKLATDAMQGQIWVDTELGRGSTFYVSFPAYQS